MGCAASAAGTGGDGLVVSCENSTQTCARQLGAALPGAIARAMSGELGAWAEAGELLTQGVGTSVCRDCGGNADSDERLEAISALLAHSVQLIGGCPPQHFVTSPIARDAITTLTICVAQAKERPHEVAPLVEGAVAVTVAAARTDAVLLGRLQLLHFAIYFHHAPLRASLRENVHAVLRGIAAERDSDRLDIAAMLLRLLLPVYRGLRTPLAAAHEREAIFGVLVPLARHNGAGTQTGGTGIGAGSSAVSSLAPPLTDCIITLLARVGPERESQVAVSVFRALIRHYDPAKPWQCANLLEVAIPLVDALDGAAYAAIAPVLLRMVAAGCGSDHAQLARVALSLWARESIKQLAWASAELVVRLMAPALARRGQVHWDRTVVSALLRAWDVIRALPAPPGSLDNAMRLEFAGSANRLAEYRRALESVACAEQERRAEMAVLRAQRSTLAAKEEALCGASPLHRRCFVFGRELGRGAFAVVRFARLIERGVESELWHEFAIKEVSKCFLERHDCRAAVDREMRVHRDVFSSSVAAAESSKPQVPIIGLHAVFEDEMSVNIVQEYAPGGDVFEAAVATGTHQQEAHHSWLREVIRDTAQALHEVHCAGFAFGDAKWENVLLAADGSARLCDFGAAMPLNVARQGTEMGGTREFLAPECLRRLTSPGPTAPQDPVAADVFALGLMVVQLLTGTLLPCDAESGIREADAARLRVLISEGTLPTVTLRLLAHDPAARAPIADLLSDPWLARATDGRPIPPPLVRTAGQSRTKNSGRTESMMWRRADEVRLYQRDTSHLFGAGGSFEELEEEEPCVVAIHLQPGFQRLRSHSPAVSSDDDTANEYVTKMPR